MNVVFAQLLSETIEQSSEQSLSAVRKVINSNPLNKATNHIFLPIAEHCSYSPLFVKNILEDREMYSVRHAILLKRSFSVYDMQFY